MKTQEEFDNMMAKMAKNIDEEFLTKSLATAGRDTKEQKQTHDIDVCVVYYTSQGLFMGNPVHWCAADYYISEKFETNGIRWKIFFGDC